MNMVYLDANASEPLRPAARAAMLAALDVTGNPSSVHAAGRAARHILEQARETLAACFGGTAAELVFTSGGTEADAIAIHGLGAGRRLLIGATEHDAVRAARADAVTIPVDGDGVIDLDALAAALPGTPALVCLMLANNETGTIQPVAAAAELCRRHGALLHVDAVQAAGRVPTDLQALGADSLAFSSHKLGGPAGAGALLLRPGVAVTPLIAGGGQERGRRGGTPSVAAIAGFAACCTSPPPLAGGGREEGWPRQTPCMPHPSRRGRGEESEMTSLRDSAAAAATRHGAIVLGGPARLPNTVCLALPGVAAQTQLIALDLDGVQASAGAACSSGKVARSHVLAAMGLGALAGQAVRVSLPWNVTAADIDAFAAAYARMAIRATRRLEAA